MLEGRKLICESDSILSTKWSRNKGQHYLMQVILVITGKADDYGADRERKSSIRSSLDRSIATSFL